MQGNESDRITKPRFRIAVWRHGLTIEGEGGAAPIDAIQQATKMASKGAYADGSIAHHLRHTGYPDTCLAIVVPKGRKAWCAEIEQRLQHLPAEEAWWKGLDVGASSATMFGVLASDPWARQAARYGEGRTPADADDWGRCSRLIRRFPHWKARLGEVAAAHPRGAWPALIASWDKIDAAQDQGAALADVLRPSSRSNPD